MKLSILKNIFFLCTVLVAMSLNSCQKEEKSVIEPTELRFNITVNPDDNAVGFASTNNSAFVGGTKAVKNGFVAGDKIYLFFEDVTGLKYAIITLGTDGKWSGELVNMSVSELSASGKKFYAVYFPFDNVAIASDGADGVTFRSSSHTNPVLNGLLIFTYYMTGNASYTVDTEGTIATLTASLKMLIPDGFVQFFINKSGSDYATNDQYRLSVRGLKPASCSSYSNGVFTHTELEAANPLWGYTYSDGTNEGISFTGVIDDTWANASNSHEVIFFNDGVPAITKTFSGKTLSSLGAVRLNMSSGWTQYASFPTTQPLRYKLSKSASAAIYTTEWGEWNLGANAPGEYGLFFAFGQIVGSKKGDPLFSYSTENYYLTSSSNPLTPWGMIPAYSNLVENANYRIYDAARAYLGDGWRMSSSTEIYYTLGYNSDYFGNINWVWVNETTTYGAKGALVTDTDEVTGDVLGTIFIPASGIYIGTTNNYDSYFRENAVGFIWGSRCASATEAGNVGFANYYHPVNSYRYSGRNIRPVRDL